MDRQIKEHPAIMERMRQNSLRHKVLLGAFGQFLKEPYGQNAGGLDIKYGAYIPMVNGVRLLAVCSGIDDTSTLARLVRLCGKPPLPKKVLKRWYQAFVMFLYLRMKTAHRAEDGLLTTNGVIMLNELPKEQTAALKTCLRAGKELQRHIAKMTASQVESP
jgi:CBS domain-containing protein